MSHDLRQQLKSLKRGEIDPRPEWVAESRSLLLSQIRNTVSSGSAGRQAENFWAGLSIFLPKPMVYNVIRPLAILLIVSTVATSGWVTGVDASYNALPGDWLYPAKRAAEKTQVTMAAVVGAKTTETKLRVEFAKRRAVEAKQVLNSSDPKKKAKAKESVAELKADIKTLNQKLDEIQSAPSASVSAETVKDVKQDTDQIKNVLSEVKTSIASGAAPDQALSQAVAEAKDLVKDMGVKAAEVLVAKHLEGDQTVTTEEVRKEIDDTLQTVTTEAVVSKQSMEGVKDAVEAMKTGVKDLASSQKVSGVASTTLELAKKIDAVASTTKDAASQASVINVAVGKTTDEARALLSQGDLSGALSKVKEASEATKVSEKITDTAITAVQQIAPVGAVVSAVRAQTEILSTSSTIDKLDKAIDVNVKVLVTTTPAVVSAPTTTPVAPITIIVTSSTKK